MKRIVVDLDETLGQHGTEALSYQDHQLNHKLVISLRALKQQGYSIVLDTARGNSTKAWAELTYPEQVSKRISVANWLIKHNLLGLFDEVRVGTKFGGDAYIDDKAIPQSLGHLAIDEQSLAKLLTWLNSQELAYLAEQEITGSPAYCTYSVDWSEADQEYVGRCAQYPSLSWLSKSKSLALQGIKLIVAETLLDS